MRKSKSSKDVLSDISSPKVRWKQNATIKEAVTENATTNALENANKNGRDNAPESKKLQIKVTEEKQQLEEEGGQKEKVRTPEQVRKFNQACVVLSNKKKFALYWMAKSNLFVLKYFSTCLID